MTIGFKNLGPLLEESRTSEICHVCKNYIYKLTFFSEESKNKRKTIFVCKNCYNNKKK